MKKLFTIEIPESRNFGLDLLRFFAIIFVIINHGSGLLPKKIQHLNEYFFIDGVSLFFVLSCFLIGGIFIRLFEKDDLNKNIFQFWIRRWMRTLPAYYFVLSIVCLLRYFILNQFEPIHILKNFLFIQNIFKYDEHIFLEGWSLAIEEWFYLLLPICTIFSFYFFQSKKKAFFIVIIVFLIICPLLRTYIYLNHKPDNTSIYWDQHFRSLTFLRLDSIMFGVLGAYLKLYYKKIFNSDKNIKALLGILILILVRSLNFIDAFSSFYHTVLSFTLNSFAVFLILPFLNDLKVPKNRFILKFVTYVSLISYSLYLVNATLIQGLFLNLIEVGIPFLKYILYWILTFITATLIYKYIELPFMKIRDKYF